jgi:uncharacterized protein (DUF608 family)
VNGSNRAGLVFGYGITDLPEIDCGLSLSRAALSAWHWRGFPLVGAGEGPVVANEVEARKFWMQVSRGGVEYEENHPTTVLDTFLKSVLEERKKWDLKPGNLYQASVYAWNAYRENKTITSVKYDTKKGLYTAAG